VRDLILWDIQTPVTLVVASDNLGGIGSLAQDKYACPPEDVGYFTARVVLFELLAAGALPRLMLFNLANRGDYARQVLQGVHEALVEAGLPGDFPVNGSSEKNVATEMTALGLTLIGTRADNFRPGGARPGDGLWLVGMPKSAPHDRVARGDPEMCGFDHLKLLAENPAVHDLVPVGSGGARPGIAELARRARLQSLVDPDCAGLLARSGGPATAVVVASTDADPMPADLGNALPVRRVGTLV
jgi:hypothetical protein